MQAAVQAVLMTMVQHHQFRLKKGPLGYRATGLTAFQEDKSEQDLKMHFQYLSVSGQ